MNFNYENNVNEINISRLSDLNFKMCSDKDLTIMHVNIRSLNANIHQLESLLQSMKVKPKIIVCSDSGNIKNINFYNIEGYNIYYNESSINKSDGVVVYILKFLEIKVSINFKSEYKLLKKTKDNSSKNMNTIIVKTVDCIIKNKKNDEIKVTGRMYRSHDLSKSDFIELFRQILKKNKSQTHVITGDFNINTLLLDDEVTNEFLNSALEAGYIPLINSVTRPNNRNL